MKTSVIICEFNPLHTGHKRLLDFARTVSDNVICMMSGNFVQRGMPAVANKYKRATHAVKAGADLVVELPTVFATASAPDFALGAVKVANALEADILLFGSECGDINTLKLCAKHLDDAQVNQEIRKCLQQGFSYPKAVATACKTDILEKPNNVLAIEYLRALSKIQSKIVPMTIAREDNFSGEGTEFASSTALRNDCSLRDKFSYPFVTQDIDDNVEEKYCRFATQFLATADKQYLSQIADVTEGLHNRIFQADKTHGFENMMEQIKTKRYTRAKLQRIVLNCVLGIDKQTEKQFANWQGVDDSGKVAVNVLAVEKNKRQLLSKVGTSDCAVTQKADRLYSTFDGEHPTGKLIVI